MVTINIYNLSVFRGTKTSFWPFCLNRLCPRWFVSAAGVSHDRVLGKRQMSRVLSRDRTLKDGLEWPVGFKTFSVAMNVVTENCICCICCTAFASSCSCWIACAAFGEMSRSGHKWWTWLFEPGFNMSSTRFCENRSVHPIKQDHLLPAWVLRNGVNGLDKVLPDLGPRAGRYMNDI